MYKISIHELDEAKVVVKYLEYKTTSLLEENLELKQQIIKVKEELQKEHKEFIALIRERNFEILDLEEKINKLKEKKKKNK